jgi:hypothetical protein
LERHQARETGGSHWLSPTPWAAELYYAPLGLTPQALCFRLLRRLKAKSLKLKTSNNLAYKALSFIVIQPILNTTFPTVFLVASAFSAPTASASANVCDTTGLISLPSYNVNSASCASSMYSG